MIKKHLVNLIDTNIIIFIIVIFALCGIITLLISDKIKDFANEYKKKFYVYVLSFALIYVLIAFLSHNKPFTSLSRELLLYQTTSLLFGILHVWIYRNYFKEFKLKSFIIELLFASVVPLYSSLLFIIIYTVLNGLNFTFLMCGHFIMFIIPTAIDKVFCLMMLIPTKKIITWAPNKSYKIIESNEMKGILLITLLIKKEYGDEEYISIRAQVPVRVKFGRLFFLAVNGYNKQNSESQIELMMPNRQNYNWVFHLQSKWYEKTKYVDALNDMGSNLINENSVIICERELEKNAPPEKKKKPDAKIYNTDSDNEDSEQKKIDELKEPEEEGPIK
ncbi:TssN family type VI secretion system protein [Flavobacterium sp. CFBP9031]|uniref:TssN family type VI secretion system protein n=1 Tax=Flavobacterium sp. CFBP9031 TaxID=3096538 RepID=UPI002A6AC0BE|nr:TssN family type VI secretion system protein [Flavobacterium sp. CFBP9031]MDY0988682.1 TssN family type VI secretion system protein [Flavobacterium sp. CFBP9031]